MNRSEQIADLAAALVKAQAQIEGAVKDKSNPVFRSKYADLGAVWDAIREPLTANGLSVTQWLRRTEDGVEVETIVMHQSGQYMADTLAMPAFKKDAQGLGSAATYARRYALMAAVGIAPVDDDGNGASGKKPEDIPEFAKVSNADIKADMEKEAGKPLQSQYDIAKAKKRTAQEFVDDALAFIKKADHIEMLSEWWRENSDKLERLSDKEPKLYTKFLTAYDDKMESFRPPKVA